MNTVLRMKKFALVAALGTLLALSGLALVGCGGGTSDSSKTETSTSTESSSSANSSATENSADVTLKDLESAMSEAYMGTTEAGEGFYYAGNEDGSLVIIMVANTDGDVVSFVGPAETSGNMMKVTDMVSELSLAFSIEPQNDGTIIFDMGSEGKAQVAPCKVSEVLDVMDTLDTYGNSVA